MPAQFLGGLVDLLGQFTRRRDDQRAHLPRGPCSKPLQDGQHKGRRLAGAGLRQPEHVASLQDHRDRLFLDRGCGGKTRAFRTRDNARVEGKLFKIHSEYSLYLDYVEPSRTLSPSKQSA